MARSDKHKSGPGGLIDQVTGLVSRGGRTAKGSGGLPGKAASFVAGFLSGGGDKGKARGRSGRRARRR